MSTLTPRDEVGNYDAVIKTFETNTRLGCEQYASLHKSLPSTFNDNRPHSEEQLMELCLFAAQVKYTSPRMVYREPDDYGFVAHFIRDAADSARVFWPDLNIL